MPCPYGNGSGWVERDVAQPFEAQDKHAVPLRKARGAYAGTRGAHPGAWAAHLYCIGDETLTRKLGGEMRSSYC